MFVCTVEGKNVLIFTAGEWVEEASIKPLLATSDFVVACDGALQSCVKHTIQPDLVIGDFDSVPDNVLNAYVEAGGLTQDYLKQASLRPTKAIVCWQLDNRLLNSLSMKPKSSTPVRN